MSKPKHTYRLSYEDYIRKFKLERAGANELLSDLSTIDCFPDQVFLVFNSPPIDKKYWYKRCFHVNHEYKLDVFDTDVTENSQLDCYSELQGTNGWLSSQFNDIDITADFLTGYYIAKALIRVRNETVNWFQYGCSNTQLYKGLNAHLDSNVGRFTRYGADRSLTRKLLQLNGTAFDYKSVRQSRLSALDNNLLERKVVIDLNYVFNGVTKTGNIADINVIRSIRNQLNDIAQLGFAVIDVYPKTMTMLFNRIIIPLMDVSAKGFSFIRLPDPHTWNSNATMFANFLVFISSYYRVIKIFKTPWGKIAKYYLIVSDRLEFTLRDYTALARYIKDACNRDIPLLSKKYNIEPVINYMNKLQHDLLNCYNHKTKEEANEYWLDHVVDSV